MYRELDLDRLQSALLEAILGGEEAQGIVDAAYAVLHLPIIAFDVEFRALAFAFERPCYYAPWEEIAEGQGTVQFLEFLPSQERIFRHGRSLLFDHPDEPDIDLREVACAFQVDGLLFGYVGIIIEDAGVEQVLAANDLLAEVLSYHYSHSGARQHSVAEEPGEAELLALLFSDAPPAPALAERVGRLCEPGYVLAVLESDRHSVADIQFVRGTYCRPVNRVLGAVDADGQLRLLYWGVCQEDLRWIEVALENIGRSIGVCCGVSDLFARLGDLAPYRLQALETLRAGRRFAPERRVSRYPQRVAELIGASALDVLGPGALIPAAWRALLRDLETGGKYRRTLECFLQNRGGVAKTARDLGVHKNTLNKRLQRMEDGMGVDLRDPEVQLRMQVGLEMLRLLRADGTGR